MSSKSKKEFSISYSPSINKNFHSEYHSKSKSKLSLEKHDDFNIKNLNKKLLLPNFKNKSKKLKKHSLDSKYIKNKLLKNLTSKKKHKCDNIILPKQILSNCWFNALFVSFFISDKGFKFFKHIRKQMIEGKKMDGTIIKPLKLRKTLLLFSYYIDLSLSEFKKSKVLAKNLNTNALILNIYNSIPKKEINKFRNIYKLHSAGNPLYYYLSLIHLIKPNTFDLFYINSKYSKTKIFNTINIPNVIVVQIFNNKDIKKRMKEKFTFNNEKISYLLDSTVIMDIEKKHFCSTLTCNKEYYGFAGESDDRINKFDWPKLLNKDENWTFKGSKWEGENKNIYWNFKK